MKLKRLTLRNIFQHESLDWEFGDGLIGILGPNGSGKSNALNAAYTCWSGDYSRHSQSKAGHIRQTMPAGGTSYIESEIEHEGASLTMHLGFAPETRWLTVGGHEYRKAAKIEEELAAVGITSSRLQKYIFVRQWQMFDFLGTKTDRAKQFAQLCGTEIAEVLWDLLRKQIELDRPLATDAVDNADELRRQQKQHKVALAETEAQLTAATKDLLSKEDRTLMEQQIADWKRKQELTRQLATLAGEVATQMKAAKAAVSAWRECEQATAQAREAVEGLQDAAEAATAALARYKAESAAWKRKSQLERELKTLAVSGHPPEQPEGLLGRDELSEARSELVSQIATAKRTIELWEGKSECPTCGTPVSKLRISVDEIRGQLLTLQAALEEIQRAQQQRKKFDEALQEYREEVAAVEQRREFIQRELAELEDVAEPEPIGKSEEILQEYRSVKSGLADAKQAEEQAYRRKESAKAAHKAAASQLDTVSTALVEISTTEREAEQAAMLLVNHRQQELRVAGLREKQATYKRLVKDVKAQLTRLQVRLDRSAKAGRWLTLLESARAVLHRERLPAVVHQGALEQLVRGINDVLGNFGNPFWIQSAPDLNMLANFVDGSVTSASDLSGGQTMVFALAYRLELNAMFAQRIGLLVLDEPTACVDADNVRQMVEVLTGLGQTARNRGHQIIVVTHEELLQPVFDQTLRTGLAV